MTSLRRRLTISYTVLVGGFILLVAAVLTWLAFEAVVTPIEGAIVSYAREAREIAAAEPYVSADALMTRLHSVLNRPDIIIIAHRRPAGFRGPMGAPGSFGRFGQSGPPLGANGQNGFGGPNGGPPPNGGSAPPNGSNPPQNNGNAPPDGRFGGPGLGGFGQGGPGPNGPGDFGGPSGFGGPGQHFSLSVLLGIHPAFVRLGSTDIAILADGPRLESRVRIYLMVLFGGVLIALIGAWLLARWIAAQAVEPLIAVTKELRRFANGDFTPSEVPSGRVSDVGSLIEAYNGAAAQVAAAFVERERAEDRMRRFLADAGHELRTPLSIVTAYVEVLRKGGVDDPRLRERAFSTLGAETTRMRRLVERLVALARLESPETTQPAVVDLGALAGDAVGAILAARGGDILCEAESGAFVLADPADLHEAITNLVDNAIKYGDGSLVRVSVRHEQGSVALRVSDCGPGIPEVDREKIFDRFYRSAEQQESEGSGLGLAIATRAAARAGGELVLERTGDRETIFRLRLPLHVGAPVAEVAGSATRPGPDALY